MDDAHDKTTGLNRAGALSHRGHRFLALRAVPDVPRLLSDRIAVVVANPDDETIGVSGQLRRFANTIMVHVTDGASRNRPERAAYARKRRRELETAMAMVGIPAQACVSLGIADQEASFELARLSERLAALFSPIADVASTPKSSPPHRCRTRAEAGIDAMSANRRLNAEGTIELSLRTH